MGKGRDKRKKVLAKQKARQAAEERKERERRRRDGEAPEDDAAAEEPPAGAAAKKKKKSKAEGKKELEALIADIRIRDIARAVVYVEACGPPGPRLNFSMVAVNSSEAMFFGGEHYDGNPINTFVYNELYRWHIERNKWSRIDSINTPPPRCSHQCVVFRSHMYMFGGEFCTSDKFHHYRDLWRLDLTTNVWEEIHAKGGPSARSGHRMAIWRNNIILFGGFYEAFREMQWYNDLYVFSIATLSWRKITFPLTAAAPGPRSGHQLVVYQDMLLVNGGYTRLKGSKQSEAKVHRDMWVLDLAPVLSSDTQPVWNRASRKGQAPTERSGAQLAVFKHRGVHFGGVFDASEGKGASSSSVFYNDLHAFDLDQRRWYDMPVERTKTAAVAKRRRKLKGDAPSDGVAEEGKGGVAVLGARVGDDDVDGSFVSDARDGRDLESGDESWDQVAPMTGIAHSSALPLGNWPIEDECEVHPYEEGFSWMWDGGNVVKDERDSHDLSVPEFKPAGTPSAGKGRGDKRSSDVGSYASGAHVALNSDERSHKSAPTTVSRREADEDNDRSNNPMPLGRINCAMLVRNHTLIIYGGVREYKNREWALDDCWSIDLNKRDEWQCLMPGSMHDFDGTADTSDGSSDEQDSEDEGERDSEGEFESEEEGGVSSSGLSYIPEEEFEGVPEDEKVKARPRKKGPPRKKGGGSADPRRAPCGAAASAGQTPALRQSGSPPLYIRDL
jgi:hypothetical protein